MGNPDCQLRAAGSLGGVPDEALLKTCTARESAIRQLLTCAAIAALLGACGSVDDEIQAETAAILARVPVGTPYGELPAAMRALGFACSEGRRQFSDRTGAMRDAAPHLSCQREQSQWLVCTRRTRVILIQLNGKLSNILVNVGRFCS